MHWQFEIGNKNNGHVFTYGKSQRNHYNRWIFSLQSVIYDESGEISSAKVIYGFPKRFSSSKSDINKSDTIAIPTATDRTYGYAENNPIKIGGGSLHGPPRQRYYLDHLILENGDAVNYDRIDTVRFDGVILDKYKITNGKDVYELFIDQYNSGVLLAPVGFKFVDETHG